MPSVICACGISMPKGTPCPCRARRQAAYEQQRGSAASRGYDAEWQAASKAFLKANPTCECGRPAVLVRHAISIARRPDLRMVQSNWKPGCASCNARDRERDRRES